MADISAPILLVDDREANLLALEAILAPLGQPLVRARSGTEALGHLLERQFAVVLMDVQMPNLDGIETAALIRQRPKCQHIPIVFITALSRETQHVLSAYKTGAVDFLMKPVDPAILRTKVNCFVQLHLRGELLRQRNDELARVRRSEADAQRVSDFEEELIGIVGHDLRGPLMALGTSAQLGLKDKAISDLHRKNYERIARSTRRMQRIVEVLLDFTRARVGRGIPVERTERDLVDLSRHIVEDFCAANPRCVVQLHPVHPPIIGCFDGAKLGQVLWNLLDNACRHGEKDAPITLGLGAESGHAFLEVRNLGRPIPASIRATLFEPYRRAPNPNGRATREGLGLGLYIVAQIVEAHGGTIEVSSDETSTAFTVRLPLALAQGVSCPQEDAATMS